MRRFFLGGRSKDKDKDKDKDRDKNDSRKSVSNDIHRPVPDLPVPPGPSRATSVLPSYQVNNNNTTSTITATATATASNNKQVAFASQDGDASRVINSNTLHTTGHGVSNSSNHDKDRATATSTSLSRTLNANTGTINTRAGTSTLHPTSSALTSNNSTRPSDLGHPERHRVQEQASQTITIPQHDNQPDATVRATFTTTRGDLPSFSNAINNSSNHSSSNSSSKDHSPTTQYAAVAATAAHRSGTSMSQNTTISTAQSSSSSRGGTGTRQGHYISHHHTNDIDNNAARRSFYGLGGMSPSSANNSRAYYPNLAILATYARDMAAFSSSAAATSPGGGTGTTMTGYNNNTTGIMQHLTWSEITDEHLVENLGGRERTRQEVLFEMVCSEERYVQELLALKENYLQPLLERHCMPPTAFPSPSKDTFSSSTLRSIASGGTAITSHSLRRGGGGGGGDDIDRNTSTPNSFDTRRPFLSLSSSMGPSSTTSTSIIGEGRWGSPVPPHRAGPAAEGSGNSHSSASGNVAQSGPSLDALPIAARFARRVSVDSHPNMNTIHRHQEFGVLPSQAQQVAGAASEAGAASARAKANANAGSTGTTRTAVSSSDEHSGHGPANGRRDISGGSGGTGTTAVDSGEDTDAGSASNHGHGHTHQQYHARFAGSATVIGNATITAATTTSGSKSARSRLAPLFTSNKSNTALAAEDHIDNKALFKIPPEGNANASMSSVNIPRVFRHHLKNLIPPPPNKLHKTSSPSLKDMNGDHASMYGGLAGPAWVVKDLPHDLRILCEVTMNQILDGHQQLSERLRARYEEQFPLVRTLADVFHDQAWMIQHYATYVLHLERALGDIDDALSLMNPLVASTKKVKNRDKEVLKEQTKLANIIMRLEEDAAMKGAPGLSICISQPFQRLLRYPLLFQSLLYHTDPSTRDYDATQKLAFEIDGIVRSIESEKASEEDRAKTRDVWARIEGITDRALLVPRADRLLISEEAMWAPSPSANSSIAAARRTFSDAARRVEDVQAEIAAAANKKKATKRLSDITGIGGDRDKRSKKQPNIGSKRDVWLVSFTDVVIRCQRVAVTKLPMQTLSDPLSFPDRTNGGKESHQKRRTILLSTRERNLYKFLKVDHWVMEDKTITGRAGIVSMDVVARTRRSSTRLEERPVTESEEEEDTDDLPAGFSTQQVNFGDSEHHGSKMSSADSRMSFIYTGDEPRSNLIFDVDPLVGLRPEKPSVTMTKTANKKGPRASVTISTSTQQAMRKQGTAAAKFSNRLRPSLGDTTNVHSIIKRAASPPTARSATSTGHRDGNDRGGFNKPTAASLARQTGTPPTSTFLSPASRVNRANAENRKGTDSKRIRAASSSTGPGQEALQKDASPKTSSGISFSAESRVRRNSLPSSQQGGTGRQLRTKHSSEQLAQHGKHGSDMANGANLYTQYWNDAGKTARG